MRRHPVYLLFGILLVFGVVYADARGWRVASASESRAGPRSVRNNPGSNRSVYVGTGRYRGGK